MAVVPVSLYNAGDTPQFIEKSPHNPVISFLFSGDCYQKTDFSTSIVHYFLDLPPRESNNKGKS
jgi:hypothetical protein